MLNRKHLIASGLLIGSVGVGSWFGFRSGNEASLTFLNVGQGDCTVIRAGDATILVDAGPYFRGADAGEKIVLPKLRQMGVNSVNLVILTHPDADHVGGTGAIIRKFPNAKVAISHCYDENAEMLADLRKWGLESSRVWWLDAAQSVKIGDFQLDIRCPQVPKTAPSNNGSVFVKVSDDHASAVLTGDAPIESENLMLREEDWRAEVMKAGHHGSRTSTGDLWLSTVQPRFVVVSCGLENSYGHPHRAVVDKVIKAGATLCRTDKDGDIQFVFSDGHFVRK